MRSVCRRDTFASVFQFSPPDLSGLLPSPTLKYHLDEFLIAMDSHHPPHCIPRLSVSPKRILDVGCGAGQTLAALSAGPGLELLGVDRDESAIRLGRRIWPT